MFFFGRKKKEKEELKELEDAAGLLAQQLKLILDRSDIIDLIDDIEKRTKDIIKEQNRVLKDLNKIRGIL